MRNDAKTRVVGFMAEYFDSENDFIVGMHHRHGNGELDEFFSNGVKTGRSNLNDGRVAQWLVDSALEIAEAYEAPSHRIFLATDSASMGRRVLKIVSNQILTINALGRRHENQHMLPPTHLMSRQQTQAPRTIIFEQSAKERNQGLGNIMPGYVGLGRCIGNHSTSNFFNVSASKIAQTERFKGMVSHRECSSKEKHERCKTEAVRSFQDMMLLGAADVLVQTKQCVQLNNCDLFACSYVRLKLKLHTNLAMYVSHQPQVIISHNFFHPHHGAWEAVLPCKCPRGRRCSHLVSVL